MHSFLHMGECGVKTYGNSNILKYRKIAIFFAAFLTIATELTTKLGFSKIRNWRFNITAISSFIPNSFKITFWAAQQKLIFSKFEIKNGKNLQNCGRDSCLFLRQNTNCLFQFPIFCFFSLLLLFRTLGFFVLILKLATNF